MNPVDKSAAALRLLQKNGDLPMPQESMQNDMQSEMSMAQPNSIMGMQQMPQEDMDDYGPAEEVTFENPSNYMGTMGAHAVIPGLTITNDQMATMIKYGVMQQMMMGMGQ